MKKTTLRIICAVLIAALAAGLFTAVYSAAMLVSEKAYMNSAEHTYAVVSHLKENDKGTDDYILIYSAEGNSFEAVYDNATSRTYIGETLDVYYKQGNPEDFRIITDKKYNYPLAIGVILSVFSLAILALLLVPVAVHKRLVKDGKWVMCKVTKLKKDGKGYRIYCDSSKFKSRKGKPFVSGHVKKEKLPKNIKESSMTVYYSEKNPSVYFVDTRNFE